MADDKRAVEDKDLEKTDLTKVINDSEKNLDKKEEKQEEKSEKKDEKKEEKKEDDELNEDEQRYAKDIFKALKDPDKAKILIKSLAESAGLLTEKSIDKKDDKKDAEDKILTYLKESLGEDFAPFAEKLGPGLKKAVAELISEHTKDIRDDIAAKHDKEVADEVDAAFEKLYKNYEDAKDLKDEITKLMDTISPGKGTSAYDYFETLYLKAVHSKSKSETNKKAEDKVKKARSDASSRLSSERNRASDSKELAKPMDLKAAIKAAEEELAAAEKG